MRVGRVAVALPIVRRRSNMVIPGDAMGQPFGC
jgi:hypothetical protein